MPLQPAAHLAELVERAALSKRLWRCATAGFWMRKPIVLNPAAGAAAASKVYAKADNGHYFEHAIQCAKMVKLKDTAQTGMHRPSFELTNIGLENRF